MRERKRDEEIKRLTRENWQHHVAGRLGDVARTTTEVPSARGKVLRRSIPVFLHDEVVVVCRNCLAIQGFQHLLDNTDVCYVYIFLANRHDEAMQILTSKVEYLTVGIVEGWQKAEQKRKGESREAVGNTRVPSLK